MRTHGKTNTKDLCNIELRFSSIDVVVIVQ